MNSKKQNFAPAAQHHLYRHYLHLYQHYYEISLGYNEGSVIIKIRTDLVILSILKGV